MRSLWPVRLMLLVALGVTVAVLASPTIRQNLKATTHQLAEKHLYDREYDIPEPDRRPLTSMADFYAQRDHFLLVNRGRTQLQFPQQFHVGTPLSDGFNDALPVDAKWQSGMVIRSAEVLAERQQIQQENAQRQKAHTATASQTEPSPPVPQKTE